VIQSYSQNLFYDPIPFEFLRTEEQNSQVEVIVDGQPAVCHNLTCDFAFIEPLGTITSFTYDETTKVLAIQGTGLPTSVDGIQSIEFAKSKCTIDVSSVSNSSVQCRLDHDPTCGSYVPILISSFGIVPNDNQVQTKVIGCSVSRVEGPPTLNLLGGDNITFTGINLPWNLGNSVVTVKFSDTQQTTCVAQTSTSTSLVCLTSPFDIRVSSGATLNPSLVINDQQVTTTNVSVTLMDSTKSAVTLSRPSASPVLKTKFNITIETSFPYTMRKEDFSVNATNRTNPSYKRYLNVIGVDDATKTMTVMFGGAWSGVYDLHIRHKDFGLL